jgi:AcrR family transcriptional regulator
MPSRRDQKRQQTYDDIKACARDLMRQHGTAGITIRGITRAMGLSATALYRYYDNLDALITDLILEAFNGLATAVESVTEHERSADQQFVGALIAYRQWALANPVPFQLIYGNPSPDYEAPAEATIPASSRKLRALTLMLTNAILQEQCTPPASFHTIPPSIDAQLTMILAQNEGDDVATIPLETVKLALYMVLHVWARVHGVVMLELFDHLPPTVGDMNTYYAHHLMLIAHDIGLTHITPDAIAHLQQQQMETQS